MVKILKEFPAWKKLEIIEEAENGNKKKVAEKHDIGLKDIKSWMTPCGKRAIQEMAEIDPESTDILDKKQRESLLMAKKLKERLAGRTGNIAMDEIYDIVFSINPKFRGRDRDQIEIWLEFYFRGEEIPVKEIHEEPKTPTIYFIEVGIINTYSLICYSQLKYRNSAIVGFSLCHSIRNGDFE